MTKRRAPQMPKGTGGPDSQGREETAVERARRLGAEGARLLSLRRTGEAMMLLADAWRLDPQNAAVAINLGGAYILQGQHDRAIPLLEAATQLEPDNAMAWSNLAAAYLGKLPFATRERQDRAIAAYERALALNPRAAHVNYNVGLIYLERDDPTLAAAHFFSALETDPNDDDARRWLEKIRLGQATNRDEEDQG